MARMPVVAERPKTCIKSSAQNSSCTDREPACRRPARSATARRGSPAGSRCQRRGRRRAPRRRPCRRRSRPPRRGDPGGSGRRAGAAGPPRDGGSSTPRSATNRASDAEGEEPAADRAVARRGRSRALTQPAGRTARALRHRGRRAGSSRTMRPPSSTTMRSACGERQRDVVQGEDQRLVPLGEAGEDRCRPGPGRGPRPARRRSGSAARYRGRAPPRRAAAGRRRARPPWRGGASASPTRPSTSATSRTSARAGKARVRRLCRVERRSRRPI